MAEGGNQPSIQDGSDADIAFACTPCSEEGSREEAVKYCPECDEYLCSTCSRCHLKMKATRDHKLVEKEKGKHESKIAKSTAKIKCRQHPDRDIEMYCGTHDMVYCLMCIATEHRSCGAVTSLTDAAGSNFHQNDANCLQEEYVSTKEVLTVSEKEKKENLNSLEEKRNTIEKRLQEIEEALIEHIKMLSQQDKTNLSEIYFKVKDKLESDITMLNSRLSEMEKVKGQLHATTEVNQENRFVQFKLCQQIINDAKNLHAQFEYDGKVSIDFTENIRVTGPLMEVDSLGKINETGICKKRELRHQKEINVRIQNDKTLCYLIDVCQLDSGDCILADRSNKNVKLIDTNQNIKSHFDLGVYLTGICKTGHNEVAVKLDNDKIDVLSVGTYIFKVRSISVKGGAGYWGIAYTNGKFWASTGTAVDVYDINGTFEKSISFAKGAVIRQMTVYQNSVYLTDRSDGIVILTSDGAKQTKFQDSKLKCTVGVCISNDGTVYVLDEPSITIVMFSQEGKCLGQLVPDIPSGKRPESLCYDSKNECILIGYQSSNTATVLHLSD
ncbi:E3 ubiquitin-protein ligase TRIM71-like [Mercenaria mercenaria]|uniref:E3 ubiquitin-protein ligase TRIM71-like n=1 Tax=Mercenaria mercenaria TaxID=6596 RepID=UPI00234EA295|nr:E3 ubiquitin-protein ligase TRIM71-like [Mercenaria mercenaria]